MGEFAIRVEGLSKRYRIGQYESYKTLRDALTKALRKPVHRFSTGNGREPARPDWIWALKDLSFEIRRGEVVGIIGRNGAGKSTLLKILSRITEPTAGCVRIRGRVGSLLEVGTGFNPELTGRENIYLNGALLGMKRAEIACKFDEIVAFAEIGKFLDTPVKRYSSGMYMRLAFSVAAHLEPDILLIDEVLAVGDAAFQKKCLGKMGEVAQHGRTVLFVSHNTAAILSLCEQAFRLDGGKLLDQGPARQVMPAYLQSQLTRGMIPLNRREDRSGDGSIRAESLHIESLDPDRIIRPHSRLQITIQYRGAEPIRYPQFLISIYDYMDTGIFLLHSDSAGGLPEVLPAEGSVTCVTDPINLTPGRCIVHLELMKGNVRADYIPCAGWLDVEAGEAQPGGSGTMPPRDWALCLLAHEWRLNEA